MGWRKISADEFTDCFEAMPLPMMFDCGGFRAYRGDHPELGFIVIVASALTDDCMIIDDFTAEFFGIEAPGAQANDNQVVSL